MRLGWLARGRPKDAPAPRGASTQQAKLFLAGVEDGVVDLGGGEYRAVLEVGARNLDLAAPDERAALVAAFAAFLNGLTFPLQILVRIERLGAEEYLALLTERARLATSRALRELALAQLGFVRDLAASRVLLRRRFFVAVPFTVPATLEGGRAGPFGLFGSVPRTSEEPAFARRLVARRRAEVIRGLEAVGLRARPLGTDEALALYYAALCPSLARLQPLRQPLADATAPVIRARDEAGGHRPLRQLTVRDRVGPRPRRNATSDADTFLRGLRTAADLVAPAAWEVHRTHLRLDDAYVRTLALVGYPRLVDAAWLAPLVGLAEPLDLALHLFPLESSAIIRALTDRMVLHQSSRLLDAGEGRIADPAREVAYADSERLRDALQRGDERVFSVALYLTLRATSLPALERLTQSVETTLAGMLAQSRRCTLEHEAGLRSCLPEARDHLGVRRNLDTSSLASTFPFTSATLVHPGGVLYGLNLHDRSLVIVDGFDPGLPNANCCVFAKSGAGKSFAVKLELLRALVLGIDHAVIDPEDEYGRLCDAVGGQRIRLAASSPHKLNPFDLPPADDDAVDVLEERIEALLTFLGLLVADGDHPLTAAERAALHAALRLAYQEAGIGSDPATHGRSPPVLADLHRALQGPPNGTQLAARLERFLGGRLGQVFAGRTNVDLSNRLVVFGVRDLPEELRPVATFLVSDFVWARARRERRPRRLVIDEAWTLAQTEVGGRFLAGLARRARKHYLGLTTISQDVGVFLGSEQGRAVLQNSALKLLLRQDASACDRLGEALKLTDGERDFLLRCARGQGLLCAPENRVAVEIAAAPEEYRLITSDPRDLATLDPARDDTTPATPRSETPFAGHGAAPR